MRHISQGLVIWFTGLSGAGKTTLATELEKELTKLQKSVYRLDGDNLRLGLNSDLGFSPEDRNENIRRIAEVATLFKDAGILTLVSCISPYQHSRDFARSKIGNDSFIEVYVKASLPTLIQRDTKGLYTKAIQGKIADFTGISAPYEAPLSPQITIDTEKLSILESVNMLLRYLEKVL